LGLDGQNLGLQVRGFVGGDGSRNDRAGNTAGTTQGSLGGNKDVGNVLIFTEKRKVKKNLKRLSISYIKMLILIYISLYLVLSPLQNTYQP
jgi:hypothetical protein